MAYYAYKSVRDIIPEEFWKKYKEEHPDYEGSCDYDGDMWYAVETYIKELQSQLKIRNSK